MLLIALTASDESESEAISCIIHLWYSAFITRAQADILMHCIRPLIEGVVEEVNDEDVGTIVTKTFPSNTCALRLAFDKSEWSALLSFCTVSKIDREKGNSNQVVATESTLCSIPVLAFDTC